MAASIDVDRTRPEDLHPEVSLSSVRSGGLYDAADRFLYRVYRTSGFCAPSPRGVVEELVPWAAQSTYHVAAAGLEVVGTVRTIVGRLDDLPIGDFELDDVDTGWVCELSSLAVTPSLRGSGVVEHLYRAGWVAALRSGARWLAGLVDPWLFDVFVDHYQLPFARVGEPKLHMGAEVVPVGLPLDGAAYERLALSRQGFWDWTLEALAADEVAAHAMPDPRGVHAG